MHCFLTCPSCRCEIGVMVEIYRDIRKQRMLTYYEKKGAPTPKNSPYSSTLPDEGGVMEGVLTALNVHGCCRVHVMTHTALKDCY